ncbi:tumor protein D52 isoform X2 [Rhinatrema bivittatum]|uniref:tumor protein D52 isoform X2 n=1 Tax=Rhinatrema bivittatum TaxID=194408 RepID=UPI001127B559|nr:tumor protein D52 isoform X2 [Rhinatrema bivittatum]
MTSPVTVAFHVGDGDGGVTSRRGGAAAVGQARERERRPHYYSIAEQLFRRPPRATMDTTSEQGLLRTETLPEVEESTHAACAIEALSEEERIKLRKELEKVEEEIQTLSQVLAAKEKHLAEIKRKLGITPLAELKQNISKGFQDVTSTTVYRKTSETLTQAGQKASAAFSSVGSVITKKLEDVKNSPTFKSFEEKVETLKSKVGGTKPAAGGDFEEVLNSAAHASATEPLSEKNQEAP